MQENENQEFNPTPVENQPPYLMYPFFNYSLGMPRFQPWYDDRADYNTNARDYYNYLGDVNANLNVFIKVINQLLRRNIKVNSTPSIEFKKMGDWLNGDITTLEANAKLSKIIEKYPNGIKIKDDGLYAPDVVREVEDLINRMIEVEHRTEAAFFPLSTKEQAWGGTDHTSLMTPKRTHDAISVFHQKSNGSGKVKFACHRGNTNAFPEGSTLALRYSERYDMTEFDIQLTSDKKWVVFHDYTIDRMTNGSGVVKDLTLNELRAVRIDTGPNIGTMQDYEKVIPTLDEGLEYCRLANTRPMIEIKTEDGENKLTYTDDELRGLAKKLNEVNALYNGIVLQSFDLDVLVRMREFAPECICVWNVYHLTEDVLAKCKQHFISPNVQYTSSSLSAERILQYHDYGLIVSCWTAPYSAHDGLIRKGVDIIITSSAAGNTRVNDLKPVNGASHMIYANASKENSIQMRGGYTSKISPTTFALNGGLNMGNKTWEQGTKLAEFWEEQIPYLTNSVPCFVKYGDGTYATAWLDIIGYVEGSAQKPAGVYIGAGWEAKSVNWIRLSGTYEKY